MRYHGGMSNGAEQTRSLGFSVVVLAVVAVALACFFIFRGASAPSGESLQSFSLFENGAAHWYSISGAVLKSGAAPREEAQFPAAANLGTAFDPEPSGAGVLIAIADEGIVRINPETGGRSILFTRGGLPEGTSAIAPDASAAILLNDVTKSVDVFSVDTEHADGTSYIDSIPGTPLAVGFVTPTEFVIHSADGYTLYSIDGTAITNRGPLSLR